MTLALLQARWRLGDIHSEDVHVAATDLLQSGVESPAVITLAGMVDATFWEVSPVIEQAFVEGQLPPFDESTARWCIAFETARQIVAREISPYSGADKLRRLASALALYQSELNYFIYLAADYYDEPGREAWFDARILETAEELLALAPPSDDRLST